MSDSENKQKQQAELNLPEGLRDSDNPWPTVWVDTSDIDLRSGDRRDIERAGAALRKAMEVVYDGDIKGSSLLKVHIGEPKNKTRTKPELAAEAVPFLSERGASGVAAGDTTVAYTGARGYKSNPPGDASKYLALASDQGWSEDGPAGVPFVVIDRPSTSVAGVFEFEAEERHAHIEGIERFSDFYLPGGFDAAGMVVNHAHLTLHGLAGLAGCVKAIAMGCSALKGKFRMHQSLNPVFDKEKCKACGLCVRNCPEDALELDSDESVPVVDPEKCIGCGECEAVCSQVAGAVSLQTTEISDWTRGGLTLPGRMADYMLGLMNEKWENTIHVLEMVNVTERCDCLDVVQKPMLKDDAGFLVGRNPFAIDLVAARIHHELFAEAGHEEQRELLRTAENSAGYVAERYGIHCAGEPEIIKA